MWDKMGLNIMNKNAGEIKCVVVGDGGVGKTSMLLRYTTGGILTDYVPTCFDSYTADVQSGDRRFTMSLIDTAGQETYDRMRALSYYDTDIFIVCFSVEDPDSFENVKSKWIPEIRQYKPDTPFILVGNQTDLRGSVVDLTGECITTEQGKRLAKKLGAKIYLECSALEGQGLENIFKYALQVVLAPRKRWHLCKSFRSLFKRKSSSKSS